MLQRLVGAHVLAAEDEQPLPVGIDVRGRFAHQLVVEVRGPLVVLRVLHERDDVVEGAIGAPEHLPRDGLCTPPGAGRQALAADHEDVIGAVGHRHNLRPRGKSRLGVRSSESDSAHSAWSGRDRRTRTAHAGVGAHGEAQPPVTIKRGVQVTHAHDHTRPEQMCPEGIVRWPCPHVSLDD